MTATGARVGFAAMNSSQPPAWPPVSVIMPVLNEEQHLADAVAGVLAQEYPGELELVLALGPSRDRTDEIAAGLATADDRIRLVENPSGRTPDALNAAIKAARHDLLVRADGHGVLSPGYIRLAVDELRRTGAANVGGIMRAEGETDFERCCGEGDELSPRHRRCPASTSAVHPGRLTLFTSAYSAARSSTGSAGTTSTSPGPRIGSSTTASGQLVRPSGSLRIWW